jgi:putative LysE/RhtB family amino acid efflux pump
LVGAWSGTFLLTLANPMTLALFLLLFAGGGPGRAATPGLLDPAALVCGVFLGSTAWWVFLSGLAATVGRHWGLRWLPWINRLTGAALLIYGTLQTLGAWRSFRA